MNNLELIEAKLKQILTDMYYSNEYKQKLILDLILDSISNTKTVHNQDLFEDYTQY